MLLPKNLENASAQIFPWLCYCPKVFNCVEHWTCNVILGDILLTKTKVNTVPARIQFIRNTRLRAEQIYFIVSNFVVAEFYLCTWSGTQESVAQNQIVRPIEKNLEIMLFILYYLNRTCGFHFYCFPLKVFAMSFCSLNVVFMSKITYLLKNNFCTLDPSV